MTMGVHVTIASTPTLGQGRHILEGVDVEATGQGVPVAVASTSTLWQGGGAHIEGCGTVASTSTGREGAHGWWRQQ